MPNKNDMRFVRTEKAIRTAFMELVAQGPVDSITASAVCRRAGVSRNAFYLHHAGVTALYSAMVDELLEDVRTVCVASVERVLDSGNVDEELVPAGISVLEKHEELLRALLPADDGSLMKRLAGGLEETYVGAALAFGEHAASLEYRMRCAFTAWAVLGMVQRWVQIADRPLSELLPLLEEFEAGIQANATRFLANPDA